MASASMSVDFALAEIRRMGCKYWDIYGSDNTGIISCNQDEEGSLDSSLDLLRNTLSQISADKVKIKAANYTRKEKGKDPSLRNSMETWVTLNTAISTRPPGQPGSDTIALMQQIFELKLSIEVDKIKRENEDKGHPLDGIAQTILTDPQYKMGILSLFSRLSGVAVSPAIAAAAPAAITGNVDKAAAFISSAGFDPNQLMRMTAEFEKKQPGLIKSVLDTMRAQGVTGKEFE